MAKDLKESKEILLAIAYLGVKALQGYKAAKADGKVDFNDIGIAFNLLIDPVLKTRIEAAIADADKLGEEFKGANVFDMARALVEVSPELEAMFDEIASLKSA